MRSRLMCTPHLSLVRRAQSCRAQRSASQWGPSTRRLRSFLALRRSCRRHCSAAELLQLLALAVRAGAISNKNGRCAQEDTRTNGDEAEIDNRGGEKLQLGAAEGIGNARKQDKPDGICRGYDLRCGDRGRQ